MRNYRILAGFMMVFLIAFLSLNVAAHAKDGKSDDDDSGHKKQGKKFEQLQVQIDVNRTSIENIELTPGPAGADGVPGADGADGVQGPAGADGADGESIQGPQGEPGTSSWSDGFETVSTFGSVQIGNDTADCTVTNAGTLRFNGSEFEACDGTAWKVLSLASVPFACGTAQVEDADGNLYDTVQIGSQCWMTTNLNVGEEVLATEDQNQDTTALVGIQKYCQNNQSWRCDTNGGIYQWNEMMLGATDEGAQGICPTGWHIPTDSEWNELEMSVGMTQAEVDGENVRGTEVHATELKQGGSSGFEALLTGYYVAPGGFQSTNSATTFWSSTSYVTTPGHAWRHGLGFGGVLRQHVPGAPGARHFAASVRCLKD